MRRPAAVLPLLLATLACLPATAHEKAPPPAPPKPVHTDAECAVWARESSFAQSVADHDAAAFAEHLGANAVFGASRPQPTRGRDAIAKRWAGIVEGKAVGLAWYPTRVTIASGDTGDVAWSSGPSLFEDRDPKAKDRYTIGGFHSVWHRGTDGVWRVLFDDGIEQKPATQADIAAFHAGRQATCPQG